MGGNGIVGGGIPLALGTAYAAVKRGTDQVTAVFFGDGAASQGSFHESLNMAAIKRWPVIFVCENNLYAATLIELKTYRHRAHCMVIPEHRPNKERSEWRQRDPIELFAARLMAEGVADQVQLDSIRQQAAQRLEQALQFMRESPLPQPPDVEEVLYAP